MKAIIKLVVLFATIILLVKYLFYNKSEGITERLKTNGSKMVNFLIHKDEEFMTKDKKLKATNMKTITDVSSKKEEKPSKNNVKYPKSRSKFMWPNDANCNSHKVRFGKNLPLIYLASFPRSGNHWFRYLLESATGIHTGSIYHDGRSLELGYLGEMEPLENKRTIAIKTHTFFKTNSTVILLLRNPMKSLISFFSLKKTPRHTHSLFYKTSNDQYNSTVFHNFYHNNIHLWKAFYCQYLQTNKNIHVIFYENLLENSLLEVKKVLKFLAIEPNKMRLQCLSNHLEGPAYQNHSYIDPYTLQEKQYAASKIYEVNKMIMARNFTVPKLYKLFISNFTDSKNLWI